MRSDPILHRVLTTMVLSMGGSGGLTLAPLGRISQIFAVQA